KHLSVGTRNDIRPGAMDDRIEFTCFAGKGDHLAADRFDLRQRSEPESRSPCTGRHNDSLRSYIAHGGPHAGYLSVVDIDPFDQCSLSDLDRILLAITSKRGNKLAVVHLSVVWIEKR